MAGLMARSLRLGLALLTLTACRSASVAEEQTEAQAWALGTVAEAIIAAEKCPHLRYDATAGRIALRAAGIEATREPYRTMLDRRVMGERFSWDTNPDSHSCDVPLLRRMRLVYER
jgi:hypothetical protein